MTKASDGGKGDDRRKGKGFEDNFDNIFGTRAERDAKWAGKKKVSVINRTRTVKDFETFQSPIDQSVISCPSKLRAHNKKHGVTNIRDYGDEWFGRKNKERGDNITGNTKQARNERIENVKEALQRHGVIKP